ncbi:MAG: hypothetical protein IPO56_06110 [Flavobacteriales bacterium]|nr:hypothetical protein [Flavobacteriales bacterium]
MRIGKPIPAADIAAFTSTEQLARFLRAKTYSLGSGLVVKRELFNPLRFPRRPKEIAERMAEDRLVMEVEGLADLKLNSQAEFDLYLSPSAHPERAARDRPTARGDVPGCG